MKKKISKKTLIITAVVVVALILLIFIFSPKKPKVEYVTAAVEIGNLVQTVDEVGVVKSNKELNLSFMQSGRLAELPHKVGDLIKKGDVLASLDISSLLIRKQEAESNLAVALANYNKLVTGATPEEIAIAKAEVRQALSSYQAAKLDLEKTEKTVNENNSQAIKTLSDLQSSSSNTVTAAEQAVSSAGIALQNAKNTYGQAIDSKKDSLITTADANIIAGQTALDKINSVLVDEDARYVLSVKNSSYLSLTNGYVVEAAASKTSVSSALIKAKADNSEANLVSLSNFTLGYLDKVQKALTNCYSALESSITSYSFTQTELDAYKTSINSVLGTHILHSS